jgi:hypothetical protein
MGSLLATVLLVVPLIAWLRGTLLFDNSLLKLARFSSAPRGVSPISRKFNTPAIASQPDSQQAARR